MRSRWHPIPLLLSTNAAARTSVFRTAICTADGHDDLAHSGPRTVIHSSVHRRCRQAGPEGLKQRRRTLNLPALPQSPARISGDTRTSLPPMAYFQYQPNLTKSKPTNPVACVSKATSKGRASPILAIVTVPGQPNPDQFFNRKVTDSRTLLRICSIFSPEVFSFKPLLRKGNLPIRRTRSNLIDRSTREFIG